MEGWPSRDWPVRSGVLQRLLWPQSGRRAGRHRPLPPSRAAEGKRPNLYFDPAWYLERYPDVRDAGIDPLFHYFVQGEFEGRRPGPLFEGPWYRATYKVPGEENALVHFLAHRNSGVVSPIPDFDVEHYLRENMDVKEAGVDPFEHYISWGYREERNPSPAFNTRYYISRYLKGVENVHPFFHYLQHKHERGVFGCPQADDLAIPRALKSYTKPAAEFEDFAPLLACAPRKAKVLAYYLPQFHPFRENNEWWGTGFTEWTNVARGMSRFKGHYQPRIPRDLGFYSLDDPQTLKRQVEMAKAGGIYGFVYYHYWFNGKRLMEKPIERMLADPGVDMPFCLIWANENWTRRWDGHESEVLISQDYDPNDDEHLLGDFVRHFRDSRYIRIKGRPVLMIYRPGLIPDTAKAIERWRGIFKERFSEDPILVMAQSFNAVDPTEFGMDGAIEFPPHKLTANIPSVNNELEYLDDELTARVFSYDAVVQHSLDESKPPFPLIKTAVPDWDNDARRQGAGLTLRGSTPQKYEAWLSRLVQRAQEQKFFGEALVCINAWNEWCESAYLEPDLHYGSAYLNATARAVTGLSSPAASSHKLLLVGHDAFPSGSQHLLLHIARRLRRSFGVSVEFLLMAGGKLEPEYRALAPVHIESTAAGMTAYIARCRQRGIVSAIVNTTAAGHVIPQLKDAGMHVVSLVHELPRIIEQMGLQAGAKAALEDSDRVIFASPVVRDQVAKLVKVKPDNRALLLAQGHYKTLDCSPEKGAAIRKELGLSAEDRLVIGVGYADLRKGVDLFLQAWKLMNGKNAGRTHFCWIGGIDADLNKKLGLSLEAAAATKTFHHTGYRPDVDAFLAAADAYALTSREDPFPTVVHEALYAGLPIVLFDKSGGMPDFLKRHKMGTVVPHADAAAMARELGAMLQKGITDVERKKRRDFVETELNFGYVESLLKLTMPELPKVSVAIPNYNYERYLPERLGSVFMQTHPLHEIVVLDDCSRDNSLAVIRETAQSSNRRVTLLTNEQNSGSVFNQWRKAAESCSSEFLWIAEADDLSDPSFLTSLLDLMREDRAIIMGFTDSRAIDSDGNPMWSSYKPYCAQRPGEELPSSKVFEGEEFVRGHLAVRNLILNVSAVVWRREALLRALNACRQELADLRMAGDWWLYLEALAEPGAHIAYVADNLNAHRRHASSVTHALQADKHIAEIAACQKFAVEKFKLGGETKKRQKNYLEEVGPQLRSAQSKAANASGSSTTASKTSISPKRKSR